MAGGGELRRSYTQMDFAINRDRAFNIRPQLQHIAFQHQVRDLGNRRRFSAMPSSRVKHATIELYRPPNVRLDGSTGQNGMFSMQRQSLNVHAKEFTMTANTIQPSRSSGNLIAAMSGNNGFVFPQHIGNGKGIIMQQKGSGSHSLQHSKSSGNVLHVLQPSSATGTIHQGNPRVVHFQDNGRNSFISEGGKVGTGVKRSKSLSSTDTHNKTTVTNNNNNNGVSTDLGDFPVEIHADIQQALKDPNEMSARSLMQLVKHVLTRATDNRLYALPAAKLCINIIEKENKETFLESLLNMCQHWYQERDKVLRTSPSRFPPFMAFLNEMYCQLKRSQLQLKTHYDGVPPQLLLLTLLSKCCMDCLKPPSVPSLTETECLFFTLTAIGRDLEQELPKALEQLLAGVRDAFLAAATVPAIRKTLLQLIELHAANWQLPASAVSYYYPLSH